MFKLVFSAILLMATSAAIADTAPATVTTSSNAVPVIIKNEPIDAKMCRLYFEDGTKKDVACDNANGEKS